MTARWKVWCAYDGSEFNGWQSQPDGRGVQDHVEASLARVFKTPIRAHCSGRTDAGVHAWGQVFHFDADWRWEDEDLLRALRSKLPQGLALLRLRRVSQEFHARFSAVGKRYVYRIHLGEAGPFEARYSLSMGGRPFDTERFQGAARHFEGWHDFRAFAANRGKPYEDTVRYIARTEVQLNGPWLRFAVEGNGFMYKMVRSMVGALIEVASGRWDESGLIGMIGGAKRMHRVVTAPAQGLYLEKVYYRERAYPNREEEGL
jgi:tRNA pseudouridine38-40 synthase